ncbi:MAG: sigma 54-interacting transcriptional regulator [Desulfuromonadaceae bacterium]|nr:sigma 54-interacting transcriptional regulator [Desulfuromonadaceae bacterium]
MELKHPGRTPVSNISGVKLSSSANIVEKGNRTCAKGAFVDANANGGEIDTGMSDGLFNPSIERANIDPGGVDSDESDNAAQRFAGIVGGSKQLATCLKSLAEVAATDTSVLLYGETGTGKELFAQAIHKNSSRAQGCFVAVDCTVLPETIVSSLLFGYEKGSFTGADKTCEGLIRQAHRGTLFLDEVGELSPTLQKPFLRVLEERRFRPIGNSFEVDSDFRLVAATNRDLQQNVARGQFRQDLLYRLQSCLIELPPLRCRIDDIQPLANYHVERLCQKYGFCSKQLTPEFIKTLTLYAWPGNVRELINSLEQALIMAQQETTLFPKHLPQYIRIQVAKSIIRSNLPDKDSRPASASRILPCLQDFRSGIFSLAEKRYLASLVRYAGQNVSQACRLAGLSRSRLYSLLKKHQISLH